MPKTTVKSTSKKKSAISATQLPEIYNKLLGDYTAFLQALPSNPYEFSIKKRIMGNVDIKGQLDYATSSYISNFIKVPDTFPQEIPGAKEMLKRLDEYDNNTIRALAELNSINLLRLRKRSIRNQILPGLAFTGSILGLILDVHDIFAVSIKEMIAGLGVFNISLALKLIIIFIIVLAVIIGYINWMFTTPRIGLVDAFGDILKIAMVHRNVRE